MKRVSVRNDRFYTEGEEEEKRYNIIDLKHYGKLELRSIFYNRVEGFWYPTPRALAESRDLLIRDLNIGDAPFYVSIYYKPRNVELYYKLMSRERVHIYDMLSNMELMLDRIYLED